jgi:hypothetical protein
MNDKHRLRLFFGILNAFFGASFIVLLVIWMDRKFPNVNSDIHVGSTHLGSSGKFGEFLLPFISILIYSSLYFLYTFFENRIDTRTLTAPVIKGASFGVIMIVAPILPGIASWSSRIPISPFGNIDFLWAISASLFFSLVFGYKIILENLYIDNKILLLLLVVVPASWLSTFTLSLTPVSEAYHLLQLSKFAFIQFSLITMVYLIIKNQKNNILFRSFTTLYIFTILAFLHQKYSLFFSSHITWIVSIFIFLILVLTFFYRSNWFFIDTTTILGTFVITSFTLSRFDFSTIWTNLDDDFHGGEQYLPFSQWADFGLWPLRDFGIPHGFLEDFLPNFISTVLLGSNLAGVGFGILILECVIAIGFFLAIRTYLGLIPAVLLTLLWPGPGGRYLTEMFSVTIFLILIKVFFRSTTHLKNLELWKLFSDFVGLQLIVSFALVLAPGQAGVVFLSFSVFVLTYLLINPKFKAGVAVLSHDDYKKFLFYFLAAGIAVFLTLNLLKVWDFCVSAFSFAISQSKSNLSVHGIPLISSLISPYQFPNIAGLLFLFAIPIALFFLLFSWKRKYIFTLAYSAGFLTWFVISNTRYWGRIDPGYLSRPGLGLSVLLFGFLPIIFSELLKEHGDFDIRLKTKQYANGVLIIGAFLMLVVFSPTTPNPFIPNSPPEGFLKSIRVSSNLDDIYSNFRFTPDQNKRISDLNLYLNSLDSNRGPIINLTNNANLGTSLHREILPRITSLYAIGVNPRAEGSAIQDILTNKPTVGLGFVGNNIQFDGVALSLRNPFFWNAIMPHYEPIKCGQYIMVLQKLSNQSIDPTLCSKPESKVDFLNSLNSINGPTDKLYYIPARISSHFEKGKFLFFKQASDKSITVKIHDSAKHLDALRIDLKCKTADTLNGTISSSKHPDLKQDFVWEASGNVSTLPIYAFPVTLMVKDLDIRISGFSNCKPLSILHQRVRIPSLNF